MARRHRRHRRWSFQFCKTRCRPLHRPPQASQAARGFRLRVHRARDGVLRYRHPRTSSVGRPVRGVARPRHTFTRKKSAARRRRTSRRLRSRLWPRTFNGHAWRDPRPTHGALDLARYKSFLPESFPLDTTSWNDRGRLLLVAGPRKAVRTKTKEIISHWSANLAVGIPQISCRRRNLWCGRFFPYSADSLRHQNARRTIWNGARRQPRGDSVHDSQRFLCRFRIPQRLAQRSRAASARGPRRGIRSRGRHRAAALHRNPLYSGCSVVFLYSRAYTLEPRRPWKIPSPQKLFRASSTAWLSAPSPR